MYFPVVISLETNCCISNYTIASRKYLIRFQRLPDTIERVSVLSVALISFDLAQNVTHTLFQIVCIICKHLLNRKEPLEEIYDIVAKG